MAILIPSKNIYDKQNPKVRDNVIERIEVSTKEPILSRTYDETVFEGEIYPFNIANTSGDPVSKIESSYRDFGSLYTIEGTCCYISITPLFCHYKFIVPKVNNSTYIKSIFTNQDQNISNYGIEIVYKYASSSEAEGTAIVSKEEAKILRVIPNYPEYKYEEKNDFRENIDFTYTYTWVSYSPSSDNFQQYTLNLNIEDEFNEKYNILPKITQKENEENYEVEIEMFCGYNKVTVAGTTSSVIKPDGYDGTVNVNLRGTSYRYKASTVTFTFKGNIIKLDLQDKTVYINGQTKKKVHSVDGNELMQTSNYYQSTDTNAIKNAFTDTLTDYAKGKETATIRCSISDYYDYDSGDKVISIDNSTGKMSFKMYDQVIPMVYGADGKDHPMSKNQDGSPKVFQVLGSKIYYDGAVWQELSLQEV